MVVRVRLKPLWKLFLRVTADALILLGVGGVLVGLWGLSDGAIYQYTQGQYTQGQYTQTQDMQSTHSSREAAGSDVGTAGNPAIPNEVSPRRGVPRWLAPALPKRDPLLLGRLEIPSIHLDVMMREGVDATSLRKAAGHLPSSALPGETGNVVILGHRDTFFRPLRGIAQGDRIGVRTRSGSFRYMVDSIQVVEPEQSLAFPPGRSAESITLITCFPFDYVGPAPRRFVVRARIEAAELEPALHMTSAETHPLERTQ